MLREQRGKLKRDLAVLAAAVKTKAGALVLSLILTCEVHVWKVDTVAKIMHLAFEFSPKIACQLA
jgi:hypothetical protein